jgi:hypothetical protein
MIEQLDSVKVQTPPKLVPVSPSRTSNRYLSFAFAATIFLSALLLFQVQLIIGKYILPSFGGSPSVWNTCMLFFQVLLLVGYGYSHFLSSRLSPRAQVTSHIVLLAIALVVFAVTCWKWPTPLTPGADWKPQPGDNPVLRILQLLGVTVAIPFFLLSTTSPLLQSWLVRTQAGSAPYRLYALSNTGSFLGLLSYPFLLEWLFTLKHQAWVWAGGYLAFLGLSCAIVWSMNRTASSPSGPPTEAPPKKAKRQEADLKPDVEARPTAAKYLLWLALSACSSTILFATTNLLCQDLAVIPLLWVVPLSLYLLSFIVTFENNSIYQRRVFWPLYFLVLGLALKPHSPGSHSNPAWQIALYCAVLVVVCMVCNGELVRSKPAAKDLTAFFLMLATGGALGGIFVVLVAPAIFSGFWEFQLALLACGFLLFAAFVQEDRSGLSERASWTAAVVILSAFLVPHLMSNVLPKNSSLSFLTNEFYAAILAGLILVIARLARGKKVLAKKLDSVKTFPYQPIIAVALLGVFAIIVYSYVLVGTQHRLFFERNFFGVKYVIETPDVVEFICGSTIHGAQFKKAEWRAIPTVYYRPESGIGLLLANYPRHSSGSEGLRVATIGLGIGTVAAYAQPGDYFRFYEIDPAVPPLSMGPQPQFEFVKNSPGRTEVVLGDGRLSLEREAAAGQLQNLDILVADGFSSDAIPVHLLTREAISTYVKHLRPEGGVLAFNVSNSFLDLAPVVAGLGEAFNLSGVQVRDGWSLWILLSRKQELLHLPNLDKKARAIDLRRDPLLWTDDYSNLFAILGRQQFTSH